MSNRERYDSIFLTCFNIDSGKLNSSLMYNSIPEWDSIGHMGIIAALEETFDIMMDTEDIIDFNSYDKGTEILKKYDVLLSD